MTVNEEYIRAQFFFLHIAKSDKVLIEDGNIQQVADQEWLIKNSPTYFEYKRTGQLGFKTPEMALETLWEELNYG